MIGWVNNMVEKLNLVDEVSIRTKNILSIKTFIKRHKTTSVLILLDITMVILMLIIPFANDFKKSEFLQTIEFLLIFVVFVFSFLLIAVCDMYYEDDKDFHIEIDTLNEKDVAFLNDVLIFPSEPHTLYRRNYFINSNMTDVGYIRMAYPENPTRVVKSESPKSAEEEEMLQMTQDEKKSIDDILKLYKTIQSGKKSIQNHEDTKARQHVRKTYKIHQSSSQTLNGLMEQLEQVDDDIKLEIQQKLNENSDILKAERKHK